MEIQITFEKKSQEIDKNLVTKKMERALEDLGYHDKELSILFTDDDRITELNIRYLNRKGPTNVLAFPMITSSDNEDSGLFPIETLSSSMLGDIVISLDTALKEARDLGESLQDTVDRLLVHGLLHLVGYDHEQSSEEEARMNKEEKRLLKIINSL
ncbi:MAG: rRNA maturation RNase YbeY [Deltaproteobacteria bacterium]|nr:rRNA maturation RNase YbeY [Deltaproteobacteria bacterium]